MKVAKLSLVLWVQALQVVSFVTYAAGIEYNEDIIEYNQTWKVTEVAIAFGEAYNKLLNHIHLYPIISGSYNNYRWWNFSTEEAQGRWDSTVDCI
jgi:hypothetical protein